MKNDGHLSEARRLTAAWLNIMAAGLVSSGIIPVFTALALEGWSARARSLALLPVLSLGAGTALHMAGRLILRQKQLATAEPPFGMLPWRIAHQTGGGENAGRRELDFPSERDIDDVLEEFGQDARAVIRALLHDLNALASDRARTNVPSAAPEPSEETLRSPNECGRY